MRTLDRVFGWLMMSIGIAGAARMIFLVHTLTDSPAGFGMCIGECLLAAMNLMRAERPHDRTLAHACVAGDAVWLMLSIVLAGQTYTRLALTVGLLHAAVVLVLLALSVRTRNRSRPM